MPEVAKARRTELVDVSVGSKVFKVSRDKARGLIAILSDDDAEDEGSVAASEVFPDLLDEAKRPGIVLRGLREQADLSQEDLATLIERPQSWLSQMESGKRPIGPKMAALLSKALKVDANVFSSKLDPKDED